MYNNQELIEKEIRDTQNGLEDYGRHTYDHSILEDVSDSFIRSYVRDSVWAKRSLRELFSKSPVWNEELQALVINGTRTHNPSPDLIYELGHKMLRKVVPYFHPLSDAVDRALRFFYDQTIEEYPDELAFAVENIEKLAPKAYAPGKKKSRVFRDICRALGVWDDTAGSEFQRLYAQFADELTAKQIDFKLIVSIKPIVFLTMSNPKGDNRGQTLVSCHSFNSTSYSYNNGCTGYGRDETSFIVFTVDDFSDKESLNNRKTTRQLFAYRPGSGILLQSRMYNTAGGTRGTAEDTPLYRDLVMREISALENMPNLWKTKQSYDGPYEHLVEIGRGFGGYADWTYSDFDGHISVRNDCDPENAKPLVVGTYGLCVKCGDEIEDPDNGMYCEDCKQGGEWCEDCEEYCHETFLVYDPRGYERQVCESCLNENYTRCERCGDYHHNDVIVEVDGDYYCDECLDYIEAAPCENCGEWHYYDNMHTVHNRYGDEVMVCDDCIDSYTECAECGEFWLNDDMIEVHCADGSSVWVCESCADKFDVCPECGEHIKSRDDGMCPACGCLNEKTEKEVEAV